LGHVPLLRRLHGPDTRGGRADGRLDRGREDEWEAAQRRAGLPGEAVHATPLRWKSAKWLGKIEFIPDYADGYWEGYGYHERGDVNEEERFKGAKGQGGKHFARKAFGTA